MLVVEEVVVEWDSCCVGLILLKLGHCSNACSTPSTFECPRAFEVVVLVVLALFEPVVLFVLFAFDVFVVEAPLPPRE